MEKKNKIPFEEFETFRSEKEKPLFRWMIFGFFVFITLSFVIELIDQVILKTGVVSWHEFGILVIGAFIIFIYTLICWKMKFKIWSIKYILAVSVPIINTLWIYFTDPKYSRPLFVTFIAMPSVLGIIFYDIKVYIFSSVSGAVLFGLLILSYSKIGFFYPVYEILLISLFLLFFPIFFSVGLLRTRIFLNELLKKRKELEEAKSVLEIKVKARTRELEELTQSLDQKVRERTKALEERIKELESFHKLTIGRELKMADLKEEIKNKEKEIEKLKKELEKKKK